MSIEELPLAVDALGGDGGTAITLSGTARFLRQQSRARILFAGPRRELEQSLDRLRMRRSQRRRIDFIDCERAITEGDRPGKLLRGPRDSSMHYALQALETGRAAACVSAGNTGALTALAGTLCSKLPGIRRPAICSRFPTRTGYACLLDVGACVDAAPRRLLQFAQLGAAFMTASAGLRSPAVALLNIGTEAEKGNHQVQKTHHILQESDLNYKGFIEGHELYDGNADVIVCDGFVGNIVLKVAEGTADYIRFRLHQYGIPWSLFGFLLRRLSPATDARSHNGAFLLGLRKPVVASHGRADATAFCRALMLAWQLGNCWPDLAAAMPNEDPDESSEEAPLSEPAQRQDPVGHTRLELVEPAKKIGGWQ